MNCPSCGKELKLINILGFDDSFRCDDCGGVWVANWVANNIAQGKRLLISGKNKHTDLEGAACPTDGSVLVKPPGEGIPSHVRVKMCPQCRWWWFAGDDIFEFASAYESKRKYAHHWKPEDLSWVWPALVLVLMFGGVLGGTYLVQQQQRTVTQAVIEISDFNVITQGRETRIYFRSSKGVNYVELRKVGEENWVIYETKEVDGVYEVVLVNLEVGEYEAKVANKEFKFGVGN